jgi:hypothetical protein
MIYVARSYLLERIYSSRQRRNITLNCPFDFMQAKIDYIFYPTTIENM